jgi:hypothetical protein
MDNWKYIENNATWRGMEYMRHQIELVVTGKRTMAMFCSLPGMGKTFETDKAMKKHGEKPRHFRPGTLHGFLSDLWNNRDSTFVLDDCDMLVRSEQLANLAKMAWGEQRMVIAPSSLNGPIAKNEDYRLTGDDRYDPNIPPPRFPLRSDRGMIWLSNKNFENGETVRGNMVPDFAALCSRGLDPYWIPSHPQDLFDYTIWMIVEGNMLRNRQVKRVVSQEVIEFMCNHGRRLKELTPRMATELANIRQTDPTFYMERWKQRLSANILWPSLQLPENTPQLIAPSSQAASLL